MGKEFPKDIISSNVPKREILSSSLVQKIIKYSWTILGEKLEFEKVMNLYLEADILYATKHGVSEALLWAENFQFPSGISERD